MCNYCSKVYYVQHHTQAAPRILEDVGQRHFVCCFGAVKIGHLNKTVIRESHLKHIQGVVVMESESERTGPVRTEKDSTAGSHSCSISTWSGCEFCIVCFGSNPTTPSKVHRHNGWGGRGSLKAFQQAIQVSKSSLHWTDASMMISHMTIHIDQESFKIIVNARQVTAHNVFPLAPLFKCTHLVKKMKNLKCLRCLCSSLSFSGVWATQTIPKGKRFGPFVGEKKKRSQVTSNVYMWEVGYRLLP